MDGKKLEQKLWNFTKFEFTEFIFFVISITIMYSFQWAPRVLRQITLGGRLFVSLLDPKMDDFGQFQGNSQSYWTQYVSFMNRSG